jgi:hypothetical protein
MRLGVTVMVFGCGFEAIKSKLTYESHVNSGKLFNYCEMPAQHRNIVEQLGVKQL